MRIYIKEETNSEDFIREFTKSLQYIHNITNDINKKDTNDIIFTNPTYISE